jgi:hypothetical protein
MKYVSEDNFFDILELFRENKVNTLNFINSKIIPLKIYNNNLIGGNDYNLEIKLNNNKYIVHVDEYEDIGSGNRKLINFIKLKAKQDERGDYREDDHCGVLIIDEDNKIATIQSVNNYKSCLKCIENENPYKIGDILTQIMIKISKKNNIKNITLTDNSYLLCNTVKISLIHLRTMIKGEPFYCKYGFTPSNKEEYKNWNKNKKIFLSKPFLTKDKFIDFLIYRKFDKKNKNDKKILNYINNFIIPRLKDNNKISKILESMINDKTDESCYLLYNIYMNIYNYIGYLKYTSKSFNLYIT